MTEWQPIETAPKDETWIWLFGELSGEPQGRLGFWAESGDWAGWFDSEIAPHTLTAWGWQPTHWMPFVSPEKRHD